MVPSVDSPVSPEECDRLLDTLSHELRRETIRAFETNAVPADTRVESLARELESSIDHRDEREIGGELRHAHLPKLESRGWLEFDRRTADVYYSGYARAPRILEHVTTMVSGE